MGFFVKTRKLRNGDSQGELCLQRAQQTVDDIMARAEEQWAEGIENPDHEAIFLELFGKVKKRKQISGAGQATSIYFPLTTYSSVGSAPINASQVDEMVEQRVQEYRDQCNDKLKKCKPILIGKLSLVREEAAKREQQMREEAAKREQQMEDRMMGLFNAKMRQMKNV